MVRNVYANVLDPRLVSVFAEDLPSTTERVRAELEAFADSLDAIAAAAGDRSAAPARSGAPLEAGAAASTPVPVPA